MTGLGVGLLAAITIAVAGPPTSPEYLPIQVARAEGYFTQENLDVVLKVERTEGDAAQALARGQADLAATSLDAAYRQGHVVGVPPPLLFGLTAAAPVAILVSPKHKDTIHTPAELRGQPVGLPGAGTPEHIMLNAVLIHAGVKIHQVPLRSFSNRGLEGALGRGEMAAGVMGDPLITRMVEDQTGTILVDLRKRQDAARWLGAETVYSALFVRAGNAPDERELTALVRALLRAVNRVTEASPEALMSVLPASVTGPLPDFRARLDGVRQSFIPRGLVTDEVLKASINQSRERAAFPAVVKLPWLGWSSLLLGAPLQHALEAPAAR
ncbi:MAG TPA: ABC transporter substrate-binding protein [Methylomirabilota bacterium]|nr:ABC transporter substrate-binding protein [Methylomirabilota bacterium]